MTAHAVTLLSKAEVDDYLRRAGELAAETHIVDMHVHATEVIRAGDAGARRAGAQVDHGGTPELSQPATTHLRLRESLGDADSFAASTRNLASTILFERAYAGISPQMLRAHMELANVGTALLLPVARPGQGISDQMAVLGEFRAADDRVYLAYSVPDSVADQDILAAVTQAVADFDIRALKLHPNLSDLDPGTRAGLARTHAILAACDELQLPLVVHGGRSPILGDSPAADHAALAKLEAIDWGASSASVVIAHFGVYGFPGDEIPAQAERMNALLARHSNVVTDTSGVDYSVLTYLLEAVDHDRILFGSDAMYTPMWKSIVQLLRALETVAPDAESSFVKIAGTNPRYFLGL